MKLKIKNSKAAAAFLMASFTLGTATFSLVKAGGEKKNDKIVRAEKALGLSTNFVGEKDNHLVIRIATSQDREQRSYLRVYDSLGELLMEDMIFAKNGVKLISVSPDEINSIHIVYSAEEKQAKKVLAIRSVNETRYAISEITNFK